MWLREWIRRGKAKIKAYIHRPVVMGMPRYDLMPSNNRVIARKGNVIVVDFSSSTSSRAITN